jgi:transcription termination/antitermination protein NusA
VIVPDDQLSLAIGREGQNARLAAKLTGWKVDIKSETEFSQEEEELGYEEGEDVDGRCAAVLSAGRRCPNASLQGSRYCGLPQHQALARFDPNQVTVLAPLADEEIQRLADQDADESDLQPLIARATEAFEQSEAEEETQAEEPEAEATEREEPEAGNESAEPEELEPEEALAEDAASEGNEAEEAPAEAARVGAESSEESKASAKDSEES